VGRDPLLVGLPTGRRLASASRRTVRCWREHVSAGQVDRGGRPDLSGAAAAVAAQSAGHRPGGRAGRRVIAVFETAEAANDGNANGSRGLDWLG